MSNQPFHFDEDMTDDEYAYVDVFGGATVVIHNTDDGIHVSIVADDHVTGCFATWSEISASDDSNEHENLAEAVFNGPDFNREDS